MAASILSLDSHLILHRTKICWNHPERSTVAIVTLESCMSGQGARTGLQKAKHYSRPPWLVCQAPNRYGKQL